MNRIAFAVLILFFSIFILIGNSSCKKEESPGEEYIIPIDSIIHSDTILTGEKLSIAYYGILGPTDCYSFSRFEVSFSDTAIYSTAFGLFVEQEDCEDDLLYLDGEVANVYDLPEGDFSLIVNLPRNNTLESKVHVKNNKK